MNDRHEQQILLSALRAREARPMSAALRATLRVVVWIGIAAFTAIATVKFGQPAGGQLAIIGVSFVIGVVTGVFAYVNQAKKTWPVLKAYIDFQRIEARLRELENYSRRWNLTVRAPAGVSKTRAVECHVGTPKRAH